MTDQEFQALVNILSRAPVSQAEALWLNELLRRLRPVPAVQPKTDQHENVD